MGWFAPSDDGMVHEGAVGFVLDSIEAAPVVDVHIDGKALVDVEGFRVVGWSAVCVCGWSGPPTPRTTDRVINSFEGFSRDGEATEYAEGWCRGTHRMHVDAAPTS